MARPTSAAPRLLTIRGLYCSGTNWVRSLINSNCPKLEWMLTKGVDADGLYGWKHGNLTDAERALLSGHQDHVMVVVVKDAFSWLESFFSSKTESFENAARASGRYRSLRTRNLTAEKVPLFDREGLLKFCSQKFVMEVTRDWLPYYPMEIRPETWSSDFANVVAYRNAWMASVMAAPTPANLHLLRYEDVVADPLGTLSSLASKAGIDCPGFDGRARFVLHSKRVKHGKVENGGNKHLHAQKWSRQKMFLAPFSNATRRHVLNELDLRFESDALHYDYKGY